MNFLCPSCRTPLPRAPIEQVTCTGCGVQVDLTRAETAPGQARLWPEVDLSGETLGGYALEKLLGSGGMGTVYEARAQDGARVAVKVLAPLLAADPELRERFHREARALAAISHPGVVKLFAEGEERSFCWYAMELVSAPDLRTRLKSGPLSHEEVRALARTLLNALQAVHAAGFVHRDLKPGNVLLAPDGPRLCDFGIARVDDASTLTASAAVMGSLRYMSPEQRWGKSDARSDLYGLGVVLHEALALGVPGEKPLPSSTPSTLARLIEALTQNEPARRPSSAAEALALLERSNRRALVLGGGTVVSAIAIAAFFFAPSLTSNAVVNELDAGVDAGELDAGRTPDAGEPDAGELDAGREFPDPPPPKPVAVKFPVGKPTKLEAPKPAGPGQFTVAGVGPARVYARNQFLGAAPGTFTVESGGFLLQVICEKPDPNAPPSPKKKKGGPAPKVFSFKAVAKAGAPPRTYEYVCPE
ncbi:MAG: serine/threonine-protein kinase [Archangium sp.]